MWYRWHLPRALWRCWSRSRNRTGPTTMIARVNLRVCVATFLLVSSCATPPDAARESVSSAPSDTPEMAETPETAAPPTTGGEAATAGSPEAESEAVSGSGIASGSEDVLRWVPPVSRALATPGNLQRTELREYLEGLPTAVHIVTADEAARRYLEFVAAELGYSAGRGDRGTLRIEPAFRELESNRNFYAEAAIAVGLDAGPGGLFPMSVSEIRGPTVFSPVSVYDAGMNSLLGISLEAIESVIDELRRNLIVQAHHRGIEYRVDAPDDDASRAVLDAVFLAADRRGYRYSFYTPEDLEQVLRQILQGSSYTVHFERERRHISIVPMETGGP